MAATRQLHGTSVAAEGGAPDSVAKSEGLNKTQVGVDAPRQAGHLDRLGLKHGAQLSITVHLTHLLSILHHPNNSCIRHQLTGTGPLIMHTWRAAESVKCETLSSRPKHEAEVCI